MPANHTASALPLPSLAAQVSPLLNWLAVEETAKCPAMILGTSSDRIGTKSGQSFNATFSKNLKRETRLPIAPYLGLAYGTYEDRLRVIGGVSVGFTEQWQSLFIFDGVHFHRPSATPGAATSSP